MISEQQIRDEPEVKENDAELNKFASTLSLASLRDQPKPEKTAEIDYDAIMRRYEYPDPGHISNGQIKFLMEKAVEEYASQSSSSLRDALIEMEKDADNLHQKFHAIIMLNETGSWNAADDCVAEVKEFIKAKALLTANNKGEE